MCMVSLQVPEEVLLDLHENKNSFTEYAKKILAVNLYAEKKVSLGYCAEIAGMPKEDFIKYLGQNKVSIFSFDSDEEFDEELKNA